MMMTATRRILPVKCDSQVIRQPICPCELAKNGIAGLVSINGDDYSVEVIATLPAVGQPIVSGFRFVKISTGKIYDVCKSGGVLACDCGDWTFRRQYRERAGCKHCIAAARHLGTITVDQF
jgi:hypothetical protein